MLMTLIEHPWLALAAALLLIYFWKRFGLSDYFRGSKYAMADLIKRLSAGKQSQWTQADTETLLRTPIRYREFLIPKRKGGQRTISAPEKDLRDAQRRILRRVFHGLKIHPACQGFARGTSIAHHAKVHRGQALVFRVDIKDFFPSIKRPRVYAFYRALGWNRPASNWLATMTTHNGALPQGAPTSPILSCAVNYRLDKRLTRLAEKSKANYSRYADDLTFSFQSDPPRPDKFLQIVYAVLKDEGYAPQLHKKVRFMRRHDRQLVTGLVVNRKVALPRELRRKLRAARHHVKTGKTSTWNETQLKGWDSLESMIKAQAA